MTIRIFEVGGSIRDELMGISNPPDRDFCAESPEGWEALLAWSQNNLKRIFLVTHEFFTIRGMAHTGEAIDIVMCRRDGTSSDGRHPDAVTPGSLEDDLRRRDFTINAIAREVDPKTLSPIGKIIDLFGGEQDIKDKVLRTVGEPTDRFEEDGLRILRAARFCVTKGVAPEPAVRAALMSHHWWGWVAKTVSEDRIRVELHKMFKHNTADAIRFLVTDCAIEATTMLFGRSGSNLWLKPTLEKK